ncbi:MAG TPA: hypothetical protein VGC01_07595 [Mucilaginibacter sp.]
MAALPLCIYTFLPAIGVASIFHPDSAGSAIFAWGFSMAVLSAGIVFVINYFRKSGEFKISKTTIIANDKTYQLDHVSFFVIKDPSGAYMNNSTIIVQGMHSPLSMAGNVANLSNSMGNVARESKKALQKYINDAGYKIVIRYGQKEIAIAQSLGELEAESLFDKVTEIAGYTKSK